ncbi:MAG: RNA polymerase sigma factor [Paracoccaceae bacterium]
MPRDTTFRMTDQATLSDDDLLALYARGDASAAAVLVDRLGPRVLRLAFRLLQDRAEAEDVTQEALLKLWQIAPKWQPGAAQPSTWLHRVAANLATDRLRRRRGVALDAIEEPDDPTPSALDSMIARDRQRALDEALALLPDRQRIAVVLRHLEGMNNPTIAATMGIGVEAVESLTARGRRRLTELLSPRRDELGYER